MSSWAVFVGSRSRRLVERAQGLIGMSFVVIDFIGPIRFSISINKFKEGNSGEMGPIGAEILPLHPTTTLSHFNAVIEKYKATVTVDLHFSPNNSPLFRLDFLNTQLLLWRDFTIRFGFLPTEGRNLSEVQLIALPSGSIPG